MTTRPKEFRSHWHSASGRTTTDVLVRKSRRGLWFMAIATCGRTVTRAYGDTPLKAFNRVRTRLGLSTVTASSGVGRRIRRIENGK
jgi:hypothetical protein